MMQLTLAQHSQQRTSLQFLRLLPRADIRIVFAMLRFEAKADVIAAAIDYIGIFPPSVTIHILSHAGVRS